MFHATHLFVQRPMEATRHQPREALGGEFKGWRSTSDWARRPKERAQRNETEVLRCRARLVSTKANGVADPKELPGKGLGQELILRGPRTQEIISSPFWVATNHISCVPTKRGASPFGVPKPPCLSLGRWVPVLSRGFAGGPAPVVCPRFPCLRSISRRHRHGNTSRWLSCRCLLGSAC